MGTYQKYAIILFIIVFGSRISFVDRVFNVQAISTDTVQQPNLNYDDEIELEYAVPTLISEVSVPPGNIFGGQIIEGLFLKANFSNNNGSIWINDQINNIIYQDYFNETIEKYIHTNTSSIRSYSLWANSSTLGNSTLYFTFFARIFHAENFGLGILLALLPIMIIVGIIFGIKYWKKKEPHSVRVARRIGERLSVKYQEKLAKKKGIFCPKCKTFEENHSNNFCRECGFRLKESI